MNTNQKSHTIVQFTVRRNKTDDPDGKQADTRRRKATRFLEGFGPIWKPDETTFVYLRSQVTAGKFLFGLLKILDKHLDYFEVGFYKKFLSGGKQPTLPA